MGSPNAVRNVRLLPERDSGYQAFMTRMAICRRGFYGVRSGARNAGEYVGVIVEKVVRYLIGQSASLLPRILCWVELDRRAYRAYRQLYRELDVVWMAGDGVLAVRELKLTDHRNMIACRGSRQARFAADLIERHSRFRRVAPRLLYVSAEPVPLPDGIEGVDLHDPRPELSVIWFAPAEIQLAAQQLGINLPDRWSESEFRAGTIEIPGRDDWQSYIGQSRTDGIQETAIATALRKAGVSPF